MKAYVDPLLYVVAAKKMCKADGRNWNETSPTVQKQYIEYAKAAINSTADYIVADGLSDAADAFIGPAPIGSIKKFRAYLKDRSMKLQLDD